MKKIFFLLLLLCCENKNLTITIQKPFEKDITIELIACIESSEISRGRLWMRDRDGNTIRIITLGKSDTYDIEVKE